MRSGANITIFRSKIRVYWIDFNRQIRELALQSATGENWKEGSLSTYKFEAYVDTGLIAFGDRDGLPKGVFLQVLFHDPKSSTKWTQLDHTGGTTWRKQVLDW